MGSEWPAELGRKAVLAKCLKQASSATPAGLEYSLTGRLTSDHRTAIGCHFSDIAIPSWLFHLDPGLTDHAAPALLFATDIPVERLRRGGDGPEPPLDPPSLENLE